jgi:hypothetical protein
MKRRTAGVVLLLALALVSAGCANGSKLAITGVVCTAADVAESHLEVGGMPDNSCVRLSGAKVYLAFTKDGHSIGTQYEAISDSEGRYRIDTKGLPLPNSKTNCCYLIVRKDGFVPIEHPIMIAPLERYLANTAVLKGNAR